MASIAIGADLGGTNVRAAAVDRSTGRIVAVRKEKLADRSPEAVADVVAGALRAVAVDAGAPLVRAGVGVAGQCLGATGVVLNAPNLGWRDVEFGAMLIARTGVPARIVNDLSAAAWGEQQFGAARGVADAALVFVGSGVGSGLIFGGRLYDGARGVAGELGHVKVRPLRGGEPRLCGCGEHGCLEAYAGGHNLAARVRKELRAGARSGIPQLVQGDLEKVTATVVDTAYAAGDPYARELWDEIADLLGTAVANLVTLLNPARVIVGGGVILGCPHLRELVRRDFDHRVSRSAYASVAFVPPTLGDDAGVVGAALLD